MIPDLTHDFHYISPLIPAQNSYYHFFSVSLLIRIQMITHIQIFPNICIQALWICVVVIMWLF